MPDYRRCRTPGGTYFFTVNLLERRSDFLVQHIGSLRDAVRATRKQRPFHIDGWVVLPDHLHCMWTLPPGDSDYSNRWKAIKIRFVQSIAPVERRSVVRIKRGERAIWQRRFWEHAIRDEEDFARHLDYIHFNPVKHAWAACVKDWPYSTFHRYVQAGIYPIAWAGNGYEELACGERG